MTDNFVYIKFRYTFLDDENSLDTAGKILAVLKKDKCVYISLGIETLDKLGKPTHKHLHAAMVTQDTHGAVVRRLQRFWLEKEEKRKGNKLYSCVECEVVNLPRFLRYPLKQMKHKPLSLNEDRFCSERSHYPDTFDVLLEKELAAEEYDRMVEFNNKKQEQQLAPNTKDKLFEYLDGKFKVASASVTRLGILTEILMYYNQEEKSANKSTIMGYLNTAVLRYRLQTEQQMAEEWLRD